MQQPLNQIPLYVQTTLQADLLPLWMADMDRMYSWSPSYLCHVCLRRILAAVDHPLCIQSSNSMNLTVTPPSLYAKLTRKHSCTEHADSTAQTYCVQNVSVTRRLAMPVRSWTIYYFELCLNHLNVPIATVVDNQKLIYFIAGSVVVRFIEDGSRYWFPLAEVEQFLEDMQSKGRDAASGTIGQGSHAFAAQVLAGTLAAKKASGMTSSSATAGDCLTKTKFACHQAVLHQDVIA